MEFVDSAASDSPHRGPGQLNLKMQIGLGPSEFDALTRPNLVRNRGPWRSINDLEIAVAEYIDWFSMRRLHGPLQMNTPAEIENAYYSHRTQLATVELANSSDVSRVSRRRFGGTLDEYVGVCCTDRWHLDLASARRGRAG